MSKSSIVAELLYILVAYDRGSRRYNCDAQEVVERGCGEEREEKKTWRGWSGKQWMECLSVSFVQKMAAKFKSVDQYRLYITSVGDKIRAPTRPLRKKIFTM